MEVDFRGEVRQYEILHHLPFDPSRKRMSIVIKDEKGIDNVTEWVKRY